MTTNPKGNWGDETTTETPEIKELFGVEIKVYPNDEVMNYINPKTGKVTPQWGRRFWFNLGEGTDRATYQFQKGVHARIPKVSYGDSPNGTSSRESDSWEDFIIAIGEMYYGATYDPTTKKLIRNRATTPLDSYNAIIDHVRGLTGVEVKGKTGQNQGTPFGYSPDKITKILKLIKTLGLAKEAPKDEKPFLETQATEKTKIEKMKREDFVKSPVIEEWRKNSKRSGNTSTSKLDSHSLNLYKFMVITGTTNDPQRFTVRWKDKTESEKVILLKEYLTKYKHWAYTYETPPEWFDELHENGLTPTEGEFKDETLEWSVRWRDVKDTLSIIERKNVPRRDWVEGSSGRESVKSVVDAIRNFVRYSEPNAWGVPDQKDPSSILSARVTDPKVAHLGQDLTDEIIQIGMKFLETGKKWKFVDSGFRMITVIDNDGKKKPKQVPNRIMVEDETDKDPHYNKSLKIYHDWGSPYGRTAPANMFVRLALSGTGWRKAEALTMANEEISQATVTAQKSGFYFKKKSEDSPEVLKVVFQTRKTERLGAKHAQHTSSIPPKTNKLFDGKHTIDLVLEKHGQYRIDENGKRDEIPRNERKPKEKVMIGKDNQFLPVDLIKVKTGGELTKGWKGKQLTAYIYVPLKEMFAIMREGTGVTIREDSEIITERKQEIKDAKVKKKLFPMDEYGWALSDNKAQQYKNEEGRLSQDSLRWKDPEKYWIKRPLHSVRHIFAQAWLRKSEWNFGLVSKIGHWKIMDVLKLHYGERDDDMALQQMIDLMAKSDDLAEQELNRKALQKSMDLEDAQQTMEATPDMELSKSEKKTLTKDEDSDVV